MSATLAIRRLDAAFERSADLDEKLARLAQRLRGAHVQSAFWRGPRGLELRAARYDEDHDDFVVSFRAGREYRLPASTLRLTAPVETAELDAPKHGVVVHLADETKTSFASDLVLYECEPSYRTAHQRRRGEEEVSIGARIRALRLSTGRSAREVAAASGLAPSNFARLEASKHQPRIETLLRVAKALGVPLADLVSAKPTR